MKSVNDNVFATATVPANASINSKPQWATCIVRASFQLVASGTAAGTMQVQASNDLAVGVPAGQFVPTNWSNVGSAVTVAGVGSYITAEVECAYEYIRIQYTDTSGGSATGTLACRMAAKSL